MFWVNAIAFILAVIPILFFVIYYYVWSEHFYLDASITTLNRKKLRRSAMLWRGIAEAGIFLSQLIWVYVMQHFGESKEKNAKPVPEVEVERVTAKDVERISAFDVTSSMRTTAKGDNFMV